MTQYQTQLAREVLGGEPSIIEPPPIKVCPKKHDGWGMGNLYGGDADDMREFQNKTEKILGRRIKNKQIVIASLVLGISNFAKHGKKSNFLKALQVLLEEK